MFFIATKSEVVDSLQKFLKDVKTAVRVIKVLLSDGDKKCITEAVQKVLEEYGTTHQVAMPHTPKQNGAAEQEIRTIVESAALCFTPVKCQKNWAEANNTAAYILNRTGPTSVEFKMPMG